MTTPMFIIAEIGSNFGGDRQLARDYIKASAEAGADAVKFQTLSRDTLMAPRIRDKDTGQWVPNPGYEGFCNIGLPEDWHRDLAEYADSCGIEFMSTPFYLEAVDILEDAKIKRYKIASGDLTFAPLHEKIAATGKPVLLSTGGSTLEDIRQTVDRLQSNGSGALTLLHCTVSYPPEWGDLNLRAIQTIADEFGLPVGLSDHSPGHTAPIAARALGATVLEKHVTFDRSSDGPDHPFATEMDDFKALIDDIRNLEQALGHGRKEPTATEIELKPLYRRGTYNAETFLPDPEGTIWLRPLPEDQL